MFETFSDRARRVVSAARLKAGQRGADVMDVGDLLLGIILEDQGMTGDLLSAVHGDKEIPSALPLPSHHAFFRPETAKELAARIEELLPQTAAIPLTKEIPLSPELQRAFDRAKDTQNTLNHEQIGPLHLLAALLTEKSSRYDKLLHETGITQEHVFKKLKALKLDDEMKQVSRDLGRAISEALAESKAVAHVVAKAGEAGLDIKLRLDASVTLKRLALQEGTLPNRRILESLQLRLDFDESAES